MQCSAGMLPAHQACSLTGDVSRMQVTGIVGQLLGGQQGGMR